MLIIYNILFPLVFLFFLPGLLWKLWRRPGWKSTFGERFGVFGRDRLEKLCSLNKVIWIHSVSVGETVIAISMLKEWQEKYPGHDFVISTTTTTGQALARQQAPAGVEVIFCPIDLFLFVNRTVRILRPKMLVILETEIWPNMVHAVKKSGGKVTLVNGRMSDHSMKGYRRMKHFFAPILRQFDMLLVQTQADAERYLAVCPNAKVEIVGNMKFDQAVPANLSPVPLEEYFGNGSRQILLAASTHPGEESLIVATWLELLPSAPDLKLVLVPRHAERGNEIEELLKSRNISFARRSLAQTPEAPVNCLLADTTGEMLRFMKSADIVIMGKSLAGQNEGHNLIEPALLAKPIIVGSVLKNFRFVLEVLKNANALALVQNDIELKDIIAELLADPVKREQLGRNASDALSIHKGATARIIDKLEELIK